MLKTRKHTLKHTVQQGDLVQRCLVFPTLAFPFSLLPLINLVPFDSLAPMRQLSGREGKPSKRIRPSFNSSSPRWHTCTGHPRVLGGGAGCNGSAFANTAAFQTDVCMYTHTHSQSGQQQANNKPSFFWRPANRIGAWPLANGGERLCVTPAHTRAHTCHLHRGFCVVSSSHPLSSSCPSFFTPSSSFSFLPLFSW